MWDDSLPSYDGSFEHNVIVFILYFRLILFYIGIIFGIFLMLVPIFSSIAITYFGIQSLKIKVKHKKIMKLSLFKRIKKKIIFPD